MHRVFYLPEWAQKDAPKAERNVAGLLLLSRSLLGEVISEILRVSITIFAHTGKTGNETGGELVSCTNLTLPESLRKPQKQHLFFDKLLEVV